jgi:hypothetical protein
VSSWGLTRKCRVPGSQAIIAGLGRGLGCWCGIAVFPFGRRTGQLPGTSQTTPAAWRCSLVPAAISGLVREAMRSHRLQAVSSAPSPWGTFDLLAFGSVCWHSKGYTKRSKRCRDSKNCRNMEVKDGKVT